MHVPNIQALFKAPEGVAVPGQPLPARPITSYAYPEDSDPNILLGNDDYLGRGGGLLFVSHAGAGKSSWIMDAFMMWAIGRPWMGIKCAKALRCLLVQAEDSDRYIGKIVSSFIHVNKLTAAEKALLDANCRIIRMKGVSGAAFERAIQTEITAFSPDLVGVNPIYLYADGDITRSEYAQPFLLSLDRMNKEEKFAWVLIHHTGKPAKNKDGKRPDLDDWESAYMGFGSSYFANWPRCTILLEPVPGKMGKYNIRLGKGGLNAGIVTETLDARGQFKTEPCTKIKIRHSEERMPVGAKEKPVYYWELDDDREDEEGSGFSGSPGRKPKYGLADIAQWIPTSAATAKPFQQIHKLAEDRVEFTKSATKGILLRAMKAKTVFGVEKPGLGLCFHL